MTSYETVLPRVFCTVLIVVTGCMLGIAWVAARFDPVSVAIVFAGALIGRCLLVDARRAAVAPGTGTAR